MKNGELIEQLQQYPKDLNIVIDGYEGGVDDCTAVKQVEIVRDYYKKQKYVWYGDHYVFDGSEDKKGQITENALWIGTE